jgi:hypothetical protein
MDSLCAVAYGAGNPVCDVEVKEGVTRMKTLLTVVLLPALSFGQTTTTQDAGALEAQYGTCAKHYIPADKCTPEIYQQLKAKDNAPLDPNTAAALKAVKEYQSRFRNPASMQVHTAYVTDDGIICLEIGGQNGMGGMTVSHVAYFTQAWPYPRGRGKWDMDDDGDGRWIFCRKMKSFARLGDMKPGIDVTEKVNQALNRVKEPEASTSQPTAHGTIGASSDGNPRVRHDGVTVSQVVAGGPADQIGIKVGDVILAIDDHYLFTIEELNIAIGRCKPGSTIKIRYRRYSMTYETSLIVGNRETAKTEH